MGFAGLASAPLVYSFVLAFVAPLLLAVARHVKGGGGAGGAAAAAAAEAEEERGSSKPLLPRAPPPAAPPSARLVQLRERVASARERVQQLRAAAVRGPNVRGGE